ncbi:lysine--tRNA ligase [Nonomuraea sp. NN258]|uniref:lysine--tRNA ligase n=1 Tax=Nonomuraea antri TaxID=2730852 RepID=UPI00156A46A5|nr:lysine--tRNA ligase [Nonomuraea antri]NRQ34122.1 lysine--tRNA ligase [Nonomuraea antri]
MADNSPTDRAETDWVSRFADEVIAEAERRAPGKAIVCASGLSPSGPIHLGNLREVMTPHLVADEIRRRGIDCVHLLSWDDYDRFRRVPAGIDPSWAEHIGKPLTSVPAPPGSPHPNWAEHFKSPMIKALDELGVDYVGISQTAHYTSGVYREPILRAVAARGAIDAVLAEHRTRRVDGYFPYRPYCELCERDLTTVTAYDDDTTEMAYTCECGFGETVRLAEHDRGKLVWKVDWPMRWTHEGVIFEPSGVDHHSPDSAWIVGGKIVGEVFGGTRPIGPMYAFVGISGMAKMSSSKGDVPTPADALQIMEAPLLRWLYARRKPAQSFKIAFDQEIQRLYDEWDALGRKVAQGDAQPAELAAYNRAVRTSRGPLPVTPHALPYRTLASVADITTGHAEQTLRILRDLDGVSDLDQARPRLDRAQRWIDTHVPADQRTHVRAAPDAELLDSLGEAERESLRLLVDGLDEHWSLDGLTTLVYGVPKLRAGLAVDAPATPELKAAQRAFFALLYRLLVGRDTGPRLPTLLLAVGAERVRKLMGA